MRFIVLKNGESYCETDDLERAEAIAENMNIIDANNVYTTKEKGV